jgi:hypothetical protein
MTIISKQFGNYTFKTCSDTGFICAKNILETYNETADTPKLMKHLNEYMKNPKFLKSVMSDFDKIVIDNKVDVSYFNKSDEKKVGRIFRPTLSDEKSSQLVVSQDSTVVQCYSDMATDDKFTYMIRQDFNMIGNTKRINSILVHPLTAVGIAMWMSPDFGSEVKDIFLRFVEGDAKLIQQTLQNLNITTGKINNIETAADPDTNEVTMLITTFEKNDYMAKIKNDRLKRDIQQLIDEKNGVISKQKCRIDELLITMRQNESKAEEERKKADAERKKSDERFNRLMNKADEFSDKADEERKKADEERKKAVEERKKTETISTKLDRVLIQRVETDKLPNGDIPQVIILHDRDAVHNECDLYVLRCQTKQIKSRIKKIRSKYGDNIHKIYTIKQPNAIAFWKIIKTNLGDELIKDSSSNWFRLSTISIKNFKDTLNVYEKERKL